jgi:hypothetical protein
MQKTKIVLSITVLALIDGASVGIALAAAQPLGAYNTTSQTRASYNDAYAQNCYQNQQISPYGYCQGPAPNGQFQTGWGLHGCGW